MSLLNRLARGIKNVAASKLWRSLTCSVQSTKTCEVLIYIGVNQWR